MDAIVRTTLTVSLRAWSSTNVNGVIRCRTAWVSRRKETRPVPQQKNPLAVTLGRLGGSRTSAAKTAAARRNGVKGGWPPTRKGRQDEGAREHARDRDLAGERGAEAVDADPAG